MQIIKFTQNANETCKRITKYQGLGRDKALKHGKKIIGISATDDN